ncbi:MAG: heme exporter protein CcmD [Paracoccaceae bacterium]
MPDLGKYADTVLSAYAVTIALMLGIVVLSLIKGRRVRAQLQSVEERTKHGD